MDRSEARLRYAQQRSRAKERGIEWEFTFEEWCEIWEPHWEKRGPHKDQLGMCRTHDVGPYSPANVRLDTPKGNAAERGLMQQCARPRWFRQEYGPDIERKGFVAYGSKFPNPEIALEMARGEREFEPYE